MTENPTPELHLKFMRRAIALADKAVANNQGGPFGCVIVKDGEIIGEGGNSVTSTNDPTAHGEIVAIRNACKNLGSHQLPGCIMYTSCEPCPMCFGAIYWARPKALYYAARHSDAADVGFDDTFIYQELEKDEGDRRISHHQLLREEAIAVLQKWDRKDDRVDY